MADFLDATETDDSLNIATKDWNRAVEIAKKNGYKEGIENGANSVFQKGFDKGYEEAFETAFMLGKFKSLLNVIPQNIILPEHIKEILDKTKRGACYICMGESQGKNNTQKSFSQIINEQRKHSLHVIQILDEYFQPYVKELNISKLDISELKNQVEKLSEDEQYN
ncbi:uncharacterized protein LOC100882310 [Megachile rotundata]|uniref:uncharacterized protein LOC100882310 n=1 Tax=Megachile rotundata TaxID=143995 RepID=UPI003FD64C3A